VIPSKATVDKGPGTRVISVGGGKGGVGKSLVATNLAVTIAQAGHQVVICDLDLGAANLHLMLGVNHPKPGVSALLASGGGDLGDALSETPIPRLRLLSGSGGTVSAANITHAQKLRIIRKLRTLHTDYVVIDVGAGVGYNALDFFELGQQRIIVATPQVTSMHDAYAFLKGAVLRTLRHHAARLPQADLLEPALTSKEGEKVKDLLARVREQDPAFGDKVVHILKHFGAFLVGNQVADAGQVGVLQAVSRMVEDYLGISLPILGWVPANKYLAESVNERRPLMAKLTQGEGREMRAFRGIVETLLLGDIAPEEELLVELVDEGMLVEPTPALDPSAPEVSAVPAPVMPPSPKTPPPLPVSAAVRPASEPPPLPPPAASSSSSSGELPVLVKPRVYVRPSRKSKPEPAAVADKERKRALDSQGRRRKLTLPGMPPDPRR
jgi:flagellar biosynthesis protein FlhG